MNPVIRELIEQHLLTHSTGLRPITPRQAIGDPFKPIKGNFKDLKFLQELSKTKQVL